MGYLEYLLGEPVSFTVAGRASPRQVADRLRLQVRSRWWPFHFEKVVGRVGEESLSIEWHGSAFSSNMRPRLVGKLVAVGAGTRFDGRFGAPMFVRFFLVLWTCFDLIFMTVMLSDHPLDHGAPWFLAPFMVAHLLIPFGIAAISMLGADTIRRRLVDFVTAIGSGEMSN